MPWEARIAALHVYPVKGCGGIAMEEATLGARGLAHDRRWLVVDGSGRAQTQRELPRLAKIRPRLAEGQLLLSLGGTAEFAVPIADRGDPIAVEVWGHRVAGLAVDPAIDRALTEWLGKLVRLVRFPEAEVRACDPSYAPAGSHTGFADGFPLLVTSEASLAELNAALAAAGAEPVPMGRFRPNIVLAGCPAGAEDRCRTVDVAGGARLVLVKRCDRCIVTTIDQASGRKTGKEPLATLARIRRNPSTGGAWFGQNAVAALNGSAAARLRVGDPCTLHDG